MIKKTIITMMLALVTIMFVTIVLTRKENEVKSVEAMQKTLRNTRRCKMTQY